MKPYAKALAASFIILSVACAMVFGEAAAAQETDTLGDPLGALREAANFERGARRADLVQAAQGASAEAASEIVQGVIEEVKNRHKSDDPNFIVHCILALGELKAEEATDVLVETLNDANLQFSYEASGALGLTWEGRGADSRAQKVNVALLAAFYSGLPNLWLYGPGIAFGRINNIGTAGQLEAMEPDQLMAQIDRWAADNSAALPPADRQPWQLILRRALTSPDPAGLANEGRTLLQKRDLGPVEPILSVLAKAETPQETSGKLAELLGQLSGVAYPPRTAAAGDTAAAVAEWRRLWFDELKTRTDRKHVDYAWRELEKALAGYLAAPDDPSAEQVACLSSVLIHQIPGPGAIPAFASVRAKELMSAPLTSKKRIETALKVLRSPDASDYEKARQLNIIEEDLAEPHGAPVGMHFLESLAQLAAGQTNTTFAAQLGNILWRITKVPLQLQDRSLEQRQQKMREWAAILRSKKGISVQLSP